MSNKPLKNRFDLKVNPKFKNLLPALAEVERAGLAKSIKAAGEAYDPVIYWTKTREIVDGFNRFEICECGGYTYTSHGIEFEDEDAVLKWMVSHQQSRRNLSRADMEHLVKKLADMLGGTAAGPPKKGSKPVVQQIAEVIGEKPASVTSRLYRGKMADKLEESLKEAYESGEAKLSTKSMKALCELPAEEQVAVYGSWQEGEHKTLDAAVASHCGFEPKKPKNKPEEAPSPEEMDEAEAEAAEEEKSPLSNGGEFQAAMAAAGKLVRAVDDLGRRYYASRGDYYEKIRKSCDLAVSLLEEWKDSENYAAVGVGDL